MENEISILRKQMIDTYRESIEKLTRYLPWFEGKTGRYAMQTYDDERVEKSIPIPVYDSTLLNFIHDVEESNLLNENYSYIYSRNRIKTPEDELRLIEKATIKEVPVILGILSKYVIGGRTKAKFWSEGVNTGVYLQVIKKMKKLLHIWDKPLA